MMANTVHCQLWMGSLEPNMTESFILNAFQKMGEHPQSVKLMRNKFTGEPAGYCFVHFSSDDAAIDAMHKLNGKPIPGTNPVVRFRLNNATRESKTSASSEREFSLWVGDLSPDVDDYSLYRVFSSRYTSIKTAKVILDNSGFSKGYGFVRFGNDEEQKNALRTMNGFVGLGTKPLKICIAVPKPKTTIPQAPPPSTNTTPTYTSAEYNQQYYDPASYWQTYSQAWAGYYGDQTAATSVDVTAQMPMSQAVPIVDTTVPENVIIDNDFELIDHKIPIDHEQMNRDSVEQDKILWDAIQASRWLPLESSMGYY